MSENAKQVMHFKPMKGFSVAQSNEHQRNWSEKGWKFALDRGNYDRSREHLNFEITKGGKIQPIDKTVSIPQRMTENLATRGIRDPNAGLAEPKFRTVVDFILSGSKEQMRQLAFGDQKVEFAPGDNVENRSIKRKPEIEHWARDMYDFICGKFGEENIIGFYVHLDETTPHIHSTIMPIQHGKFAFKEMFAGKDKYEFSEKSKSLHNDLAEVNKRWDLNRGTSITQTGTRNRPTEEYRRHLDTWCATMEEEVKQYQKVLSDLNVEISLAERRVKGLTSMVYNLEKEKLDKECLVAELYRQLKNKEGDSVELAARLEDLQEELSKVDEKLTDKREKLTVADRKLEELNKDMVYIQEYTDDLKQDAYKYSREVQTNVGSFIKDAMLEELVNDFRIRRSMMSEEEMKLLHNSSLEVVAEQGSQILHCATLLFLGYIDQATTFAQGHGGGGGGNLKWGRDDDEDNRQWARRCLMLANKMMRSSGTNSRKR